MALTVTYETVGYSTTSNSSVTCSFADVAVDELAILVVSADNAGSGGAASLTGVYDSAGNTWVERAFINRDPGGANEGTTLGVYTSLITSALVSGSCTATFSPNTQHKSIALFKVNASTSGYVPSVRLVGSSASGNASGTYSVTTSSVTNGEALFCTIGVETGTGAPVYDSDTTRGSWAGNIYAAPGTPPNLTNGSITQWKVVTGTGTQTWDVNPSGSPDYAATYLIIEELLNAATYTLNADTASYSISENQDTELAFGRIFATDTQSYNISGTAANFVYARSVSSDAGSYSVAGDNTGLILGGAPTGYTFTVDDGSYIVQGTDATFDLTYILAAATTSYSVGGSEVSLQKGQTLTGDAGAYAVNGTVAGFLYSYLLPADSNSYSTSGTAANFLYGRSVEATAGSYAVTGSDVVFSAGQRRFTVLEGEYAITGKKAAVYWNPGSTYTLVGPDPGIKFWSNPDGLVVSYPRLISFLKYIRRPTNINGNGNVMVTSDAGSGLFSSVGHLRVTLVDGSSYVGVFAADGSVNALLITDPDGEPDQLFDPCGALRIIEADATDYGAYAPNGALYVVNLK